MAQLHTTGEELFVDVLAGARSQPPSTWYIGLYNDSDDSLTDDDTYAAITTEPTTGYDGPATVSWPGDFATEAIAAGTPYGGVYVIDITASVSFDISGAVADEDVVDSVYVATDFQSDRLSQTSATRNLVWTNSLPETPYDLGDDSDDTFTLEGVRWGVD